MKTRASDSKSHDWQTDRQKIDWLIDVVTCRNASHVPFITTPASRLPAQPPEAAAWISKRIQFKNHPSALSDVKRVCTRFYYTEQTHIDCKLSERHFSVYQVTEYSTIRIKKQKNGCLLNNAFWYTNTSWYTIRKLTDSNVMAHSICIQKWYTMISTLPGDNKIIIQLYLFYGTLHKPYWWGCQLTGANLLRTKL